MRKIIPNKRTTEAQIAITKTVTVLSGLKYESSTVSECDEYSRSSADAAILRFPAGDGLWHSPKKIYIVNSSKHKI